MTSGGSNEIPTDHSRGGDLRRQTAVVTGSSGGIGRAIALELAAAGAAVAVHGRNAAGAEATARAIEAAGGTAKVFLADLAAPRACTDLVAAAWDWRGGVDIWVNNAGVDVLTGEAARWPFERKLAALWEVDVAATIRLARDVGRRMVERAATGRPGGSIINIGWDQAETGMAGDSGEMFSAIKGAVMAFTRSLAHTLAPQVRVNCVAPGWIKTEWGDQASDYWQARAVGDSLRERWGRPEDVAQAVCYLASPAADFVTGHILPVNGGLRRSARYPDGQRPNA
jgi:3-oxoacyl-[acyl-carrier protein] reductase